MKKQKLGLNDFETVKAKELLEIKGGLKIDSSLIFGYGRGSNGGGGGIVGANGCPKCREAYEQNGTPIPRRCNGSSHFSGSLSAAWDNFWNGGNPHVGAYPTIISAGVGYANDPVQQFQDYYSNYNVNGGGTQQTSMPSRARIIAALNTCQ